MIKLLFLFFISFHVWLYLCSLVLTYKLMYTLPFVDRLVSAFIIVLSLIYTVTLFLGYFHVTNLISYLFSTFFISLLFVIYKGNLVFTLNKLKKEFYTTIKKLLGSVRNNPWLFFLFTLVIFEFIIIIRFIVLFPPEGWDSYSYHLPISAEIYKQKGFPGKEFILMLPHFAFPKNFEFLIAIYYLFTKTIRGSSILHLPFVFFSTLSMFSLCRKLGIDRMKSFFILGGLLVPIIPQQIATSYVDLEVASLFLIFLSMMFVSSFFLNSIALLSLSIAVGTKFSYLPIFLIYFIYYSLKYSRVKITKILFVLFLIITTSAHYYIYNYLIFKNPLGFFSLKILKFEVFKGPLQPEKAAEFKLRDYNLLEVSSYLLELPQKRLENHLKYYYCGTRNAGFGSIFFSLGFPSLLMLFFLSIFIKDKKILTLYLWLFTHFFASAYQWWPRFHIYLPFVSLLFTIYLWNKLELHSLEPIFLTIFLFSLIEGSVKKLENYPFSKYFSYKEKIFEVPQVHVNFRNTLAQVYTIFEKNKIIPIWYINENKWRENKITGILRYLVSIDFDKKLERIYKPEEILNYNIIISPPDVNIKGYKKILKTRYLSVWKKQKK